MKNSKIKLKIDNNYTLPELQVKINEGYKIVTFQYCISLVFAITLIRLSPAFLIPPNETNLKKYKKPYDRLSLIFGWWGIPWGPIKTLSSIKVNKRGGIDVTKDIMLNLDEASLANQEVLIEKVHTIFMEPNKTDIKNLTHTVKKDFETDFNIHEIVVGLFINTDDGTEPYITIGLKLENSADFDFYIEKIQTSLHRKYYEHAYFEFIEKSKHESTYALLKEQGYTLVDHEKTY